MYDSAHFVALLWTVLFSIYLGTSFKHIYDLDKKGERSISAVVYIILMSCLVVLFVTGLKLDAPTKIANDFNVLDLMAAIFSAYVGYKMNVMKIFLNKKN